MIVLDKVTFAYRGHESVFETFDWEVAQGDAWAVLGPSGCGKSTLLYLLAGLRRVTSGEIHINGELQNGARPRTGLILQDYGLLPWITALKNIIVGLQIRRFYGPDGKHSPSDEDLRDHSKRADHWVNRLKLSAHIEKYPVQLSGGQRQRVAIARTLALNPDLLLMDEPFSSLDAPTRESLQNLTFELRLEANLTMIVVTHAIEEAAILGQKILVLGQPPNKRPIVIENPKAGDPNYRNHTSYQIMCNQLRKHLGK